MIHNFKKRKLFFQLSFIIGLFLFFPVLKGAYNNAQGTTYFVDGNNPSCNDGNIGTEDEPWCTISKANSILQAGNLVLIKKGTYNEKINPSNQGTNTKPIIYSRFGSDDVVINCADLDYCVGPLWQSYITITGLTMKDPKIEAILLYGGEGRKIIGNTIFNTPKNGIQVHWGSKNDLIENNIIYDFNMEEYRNYGVQVINNSINTIIRGNEIYRTFEGTGKDTTGIMIDNLGEASVIENNYIHDIKHDGIVTWRPPPNSDMIIRNNIIKDMGGMGIAADDFFFHGGGSTVIIENNTVYNCCKGDALDTNAIRVRSVPSPIIQYNLVYDSFNGENNHNGISVDSGADGSSSDQRVYHNTIFGVDKGIVFINSENGVIKNNIVKGTRKELMDIDSSSANGFLSDYNDFYPFGSIIYNGSTYSNLLAFQTTGNDVNSKSANPFFVNETEHDFTLQPGSPAIDAGIYIVGVNDGYIGLAPDIGAYESSYSGDTTPPTRGSIIYTGGDSKAAFVALTVSDGTDAGSGINTSSRIIQRKSATLSNGTCGSFGAWSTISPTGSYPNFTDNTVSSGNCYQYQYLVSDNTGNQATYSPLDLGMGLFSNDVMAYFDGWVDTLIANGITNLRVDIPDYQNTSWLTRSKPAVIKATAKGVKVTWGVSSNSYNNVAYTITAANWPNFRQAILDAAAWAQANGVYEFQIGNEEELHNDDTTLTDAQLITNLKSVAKDVQSIFAGGNVSYTTTGQWFMDEWHALGRGDIDILAFNVYTNQSGWAASITNQASWWPGHTYITEFSLNTQSLDIYSTNETAQASGLASMIATIKAAGITRANFFDYGPDANFGAMKADGTYRLLWNTLKSNINSVIVIAPSTSLSVNLTANPFSGTAPLTTTLSADVSETATGTTSYSFWWNCQNTSTNVGTVEAACGVLPALTPGSCSSNTNGYKCNAVNTDPQTVSHTYAVSGTYTAKVIAERGTALPAEARTAAISVIPSDTISPTISNVLTSNIAQTSATVAWVTDEPATSQIEYGLTTVYGSQTTLDSNLTTSHSQNLTSLSAGTLYNFRVVSKDAVGNQSVSINYTFTTISPPQADSTPPAKITNLTTSNITETSADLSWTSPGDDGNQGTAYQYDIRYSTFPITEANWNQTTQATGEPTPKSSGNTESFTLVGLSPSATYYSAIKTSDEVPNWSELSNIIQATTLTPPPKTLSVSLTANPSSGTAPLNRVDLTATVSGTAQGTINYTFYCNRSDTGTNITQGYAKKVDNTTQNPYTVNNVCSYASLGQYSPKVIVERGTLVAEVRITLFVTEASVNPPPGGGGGGSHVPPITDTIPPQPVTNFQAQPGDSQILLTWQNPPDSDFVGVRVLRKTTSFPVSPTDGTLVYNGKKNSSVDTKLSNAQTYYYTIFAYDKVPNYSQGVTVKSAPIVGITSLAVISPVTKKAVSGIPDNYKFTQSLYLGKRNTDVTYLQTFLKDQGTDIYPKGLVTGYFGLLTKAAVIKFQIKYKIIVSSYSPGAGLIGIKTRAKINEILGR